MKLLTNKKAQPTPVKRVQPETKLRFLPTAWAKLVYFRDHGDTEIGGFGVASAKDLLLIEDFVTVRQKASPLSIAFEDEAVADFFDAQIDAGRRPEQFARIWLHTHPDDPCPSGVDEETFERVFGRCSWAVLFVLGRGGRTYARLRFNVGPRGGFEIPAGVDYRLPFGASDHEAWKSEYEANIRKDCLLPGLAAEKEARAKRQDQARPTLLEGWRDDLEAMEAADRRFILQNGLERWDGWEEEPWD